MEIKYDLAKLEKITNGFATLTGVTISFCDINGKTLIRSKHKMDFCSAMQTSEENIRRCRCSDSEIFEKCIKSQQLEHHICYAGLCDLAMPILKNDILVGYVIMGRMRTPDSSYRYTPSPVLEKLYHETPLFTYDKIDCLKDLLPQILFENAIKIEEDSLLLQITGYIKSHLTAQMSIDSICRHFHISKNTLYEMFHAEMHCTVNAYITEQRIKKAKRLLDETSEPIYRIAYMVGIENYTYFCKLFKRKVGMTPDTYRKQATL